MTRRKGRRIGRARNVTTQDAAFINRITAIAKRHSSDELPPIRKPSDVLAAKMQLATFVEGFRKETKSLPRPNDHRLRKVRDIVLEAVRNWQAIIEDVNALGDRDHPTPSGAIQRIREGQARWDEQTAEIDRLLTEYVEAH